MDTNDQAATSTHQLTAAELPSHSFDLTVNSDVAAVLTAPEPVVHAPTAPAELPPATIIAGADIASVGADVTVPAGAAATLPSQTIDVSLNPGTIGEAHTENVATSHNDATEAAYTSNNGVQSISVEQVPLTVNLESTVNADFIQQLRELLAKHEDDVEKLVDDLVTESLKPVVNEFEEIQKAIAELRALVEHRVVAPGELQLGERVPAIDGHADNIPAWAKELKDQITSIERRIRGTV
jgi:hypothetical protein